METPHIFIDTSVFRNKGFDLTNDAVEMLRKLAKEGEIFIHTTSITKRECEKNLLEMINEQESKVNKLNVHLRNGNKNEINFKELKKIRIANWKTFISEFNEIPLFNESIEQVFDRYFNFEPPFDSKNKKHEFPDAFVLETLRNWCVETKNKLYVISSDNPFSSYDKSEIRPLSGIEKFLDIHSKFKEEQLYKFAKSSYEFLKDSIIMNISEQFEARYFDVPDLLDAEVSDVEIEKVDLGVPYFININEDSCQIDIDVDIYFEASLSHDDPDMIYRDSDTRDLVSLERIHESINLSITITVTVEINLAKTGNEIDSTLQAVILPKEIEERISSDTFDHYEMISREI